MSQGKYVAPEYERTAFHCPLCNVYADQSWSIPYLDNAPLHMLRIAICAHCRDLSFWINEQLVFPHKITAPLAHEDMPKPVLEYYDEARKVSVSSPRAAATLLRLAAKKLCESLGEKEPGLYLSIVKLGRKGLLPQSVIQSLHTVRIVGNEGGAHEGQIDLTGKDNKELVDKLFWLINFIVEKTITEPKEVQNTFSSLPKDKRQGVEDGDKQKN